MHKSRDAIVLFDQTRPAPSALRGAAWWILAAGTGALLRVRFEWHDPAVEQTVGLVIASTALLALMLGRRGTRVRLDTDRLRIRSGLWPFWWSWEVAELRACCAVELLLDRQWFAWTRLSKGRQWRRIYGVAAGRGVLVSLHGRPGIAIAWDDPAALCRALAGAGVPVRTAPVARPGEPPRQPDRR